MSVEVYGIVPVFQDLLAAPSDAPSEAVEQDNPKEQSSLINIVWP